MMKVYTGLYCIRETLVTSIHRVQMSCVLITEITSKIHVTHVTMIDGLHKYQYTTALKQWF